MKVFYEEAIHPYVCRYMLYEDFSGGGIYCNVMAQRCCEETI